MELLYATLGVSSATSDLWLPHLVPQITNEQNAMLTMPVLEAKIAEALWSMQSEKPPGPD